jgi:hypothetical protein
MKAIAPALNGAADPEADFEEIPKTLPLFWYELHRSIDCVC